MKRTVEQFLAFLGRNRVLLKAALGTAIAVFIITLFIPNTYKATVSILPSGVLGGGGKNGLAAAASMMGFSLGGGGDADDSYQDILESRVMGERMLDATFEYDERYFIWQKARPQKKTLYQYLDEENRDDAFRAFSKLVSVNRDFKSKLITIRVRTRSPQLSLALAQRLLKELNDFVNSVNDSVNASKVEYADKQLAGATLSMNKAEARFKGFLYGNRNYSSTTDPEVRLKGMDLENEVTFWKQLVTQLKLAKEQALSEANERIPKVAILDPGSLPIQKDQPKRAMLIIVGFLLGWAGAWYLQQRVRVHSWISEAYAGKTAQS